jgi:FkbM family methyltransferase
MGPLGRSFPAAAFLAAALLCGAACEDAEAPAQPTADPPPQAEAQHEIRAAYLRAFPHDRYQVVDVDGAGKFYLDDNTGLVQKTLRGGEPWSPEIIEVFRKYARPGSTAIDVGAHIGSLAVPLAKIVGSSGQVFAFEPQQRVHRELHHNFVLNGFEHAQALMMAVSSEPGFIEMDPPFPDDGWTRVGTGGQRVEARTLDSFELQDVSLIKIDVEGHEVEVVMGALETIDRWHPVLIIEMGKVNRAVIEPLLEQRGYRLDRLSEEWVDWIAIHESG